MSRARNLADVISGAYDVPAAALDNAVPADGSITAAKLASSLNLTGKTVVLPTGVGGKIIQHVQNSFADPWASTVSTTWANFTAYAINFTPLLSNSTLLIIANTSLYANSSHNGAVQAILKDGSPVSFLQQIVQTPEDYNYTGPHTLIHYENSGSTSSRTYTVGVSDMIATYSSGVYMNTVLGTGTQPTARSTLTVMEFAP